MDTCFLGTFKNVFFGNKIEFKRVNNVKLNGRGNFIYPSTIRNNSLLCGCQHVLYVLIFKNIFM